MKYALCLTLSIFSSWFLTVAAQIDSRELLNQYNRVVKSGETLINYTQEEYTTFLMNEVLADEVSALTTTNLGDMECSKAWEYANFGTCIGNNNSLIPYDFQQDGTIELIASASVSGFGAGGFWYILKYNTTISGYEKVFISNQFEDRIDKMILADIGDDGNAELLYATGGGFYIVDLTTLTQTAFPISAQSGIGTVTQIVYADGDNDGEKEIILSDNNDFVLFNASDFTIKHNLDIAAGDFSVGQVDGDADLEIVFSHGLTLQLAVDGTYLEEYDFRINETAPQGFVRLSDIDGDGFEEAIVADDWYRIVIYDVNLNAPKYEIESELDIDAFLMIDVNNDGVEEIIYGDGQWGNIYCHNAANGALLWNIPNPEHGTTGIAIADFDSDQNLEIVWGGGCSSTGADNLFIHRVSNQNFEWKSLHIDGPFYALEIEDVDQDGEQEIITISYESGSGYDSGILTIYDAITKNIEFQSNGNFFGNIWTGVYNVEISDYGNDGDLDIILAAGQTYDGAIWVVDGDTYQIESMHEYNWQDGIDEFYALEVADIDNDGADEFICANNNKVYVINSSNYQVEWSSVTLPGSRPRGLLSGDIDGDNAAEIIFCMNTIYSFGSGDYLQQQSLANNYRSIYLYDWDNSGDLEVIGGTSSGELHILDGSQLTLVETLNVGTTAITGINAADLNGDGAEELLATSDGRLIAVTQEGNYLVSNKISVVLGEYDALKIKDYNNDGQPNILVGTSIGITEINTACTTCLWFDADLVAIDPTCGESNGILIGSSADETTVFSFGTTTFQDTLSNLTSANLNITAANDNGCQKTLSAVLVQQNLISDISTADKSCFGENDGYAVASVLQGVAPYTYNWSNGVVAIDTLLYLDEGQYSLTITDANDCENVQEFTIEQSQISTSLSINGPACVGQNNGSATLSIQQGQFPYTFLWDNNSGDVQNNNLEAGLHTVSVTDANGCVSIEEFEIESAELLLNTEMLTASCNGEPDGSGEVSVMEGTPPYFYSWSNGSQSSTINNVSTGTYFVSVLDGNGCIQLDSVTINEAVLDLLSAVVNPLCANEATGSAVIFVTEGAAPISYQWNTGAVGNSISNLTAGTYFVLVRDSLGCQVVEPISITAPDPIEIMFEVTNDDPTTSALEGAISPTVTGGVPPYFYNWNNGSMSENLLGVEIGSYTLSITDINECQAEEVTEVTIVSGVKEAPADLINLYPNPCINYTQVMYQGAERLVGISILADDGKTVLQLANPMASGGVINLDVSKLVTGSYFLLFEFENQLYYKSLIKQ